MHNVMTQDVAAWRDDFVAALRAPSEPPPENLTVAAPPASVS